MGDIIYGRPPKFLRADPPSKILQIIQQMLKNCIFLQITFKLKWILRYLFGYLLHQYVIKFLNTIYIALALFIYLLVTVNQKLITYSYRFFNRYIRVTQQFFFTYWSLKLQIYLLKICMIVSAQGSLLVGENICQTFMSWVDFYVNIILYIWKKLFVFKDFFYFSFVMIIDPAK